MGDIICINATFSDSDWNYFRKWGIKTPELNKIYSCREVVNYPSSPKGLLLNEIVNPLTPKISPSTGMEGKAEQTFRADRFANLDGTKLELSHSIKEKV